MDSEMSRRPAPPVATSIINQNAWSDRSPQALKTQQNGTVSASLVQGNPDQVVLAGIYHIRTDQAVFLPLLDHVGAPARYAADREQRRELVDRDIALVKRD